MRVEQLGDAEDADENEDYTYPMDNSKALRVLEEQVRLAKEQPVDGEWVDRVERLSRMCAKAHRTHIAMLGTALLAKATDPNIDPLALKVSSGVRGAYSARALAKDVLAANAPRLGIDLGVSGREPLNNQPYFRGDYINDELAAVVLSSARPKFEFVRESLLRLSVLSGEQAKLALRAFLQVRRKTRKNYSYAAGSKSPIVEGSFAVAVARFVEENSEGGKRAQAVTAGFLDVMYTSDDVLVSRINDPDRRFPGDVAVSQRDGGEGLERAFEVRDKIVTENDLYHFVEKAAGRSVSRAAVIAVSPEQLKLDDKTVTSYAERLGVKLRYYSGWTPLLSDVLFHSSNDLVGMLEGAISSILTRLEELEVSESGIELWLRLADEVERLQEEQ